jgi:hypothetical protein
LRLQDITEDTCTNNFATLNSVDGSYDSLLSEGNLVLDTSGGGNDVFGRGTIGFSQGKWYWEVKSIIDGGHGNRKIVGVVDTETPDGNFEYAPPSGYYALCTKRLAEFG